ncbi:MAG: acyl--CoA ligase [Oscillospiraceae bacterium]|nr:acyl--CoA ligase [Oscillospiraceae bacterium]
MSHQDFVKQFETVCAQYADKAAITYMRDDGSKTDFTFGEIFQRVRAAKEQFAAVGLRPGDRAAVISPHSPFAVFAGVALAYANITSVLIDPTLPKPQLNKLIVTSDLRAIFTIPEIYENRNKECMVDIYADILVFDLSYEEKEYLLFPESSKTMLLSATKDLELDVVAILFSSGTTSEQKGVELTFTAVNESRSMYNQLSNLTDIDTGLLTLPFYHVAGFFCFYQFFLCGCGLGFVENMDASKIAAAFHKYQPSFFALIPKFYEIVEQKIRQEARKKGALANGVFKSMLATSHFFRKCLGMNIGRVLLKSIRNKVFGEKIKLLGVGASSCKESNIRFFLDLGVETFANFYALTETYVPTVSTGVFDRYPAGTEGKVTRFDGIDVKIHAPDENGVGEIRVKTVLIMKGYFRDPELTAAAFDGDGYFKTGDLGYIDKKGYLHVTGRMKEAILLHTGKKVAPSDVDALYGAVCPNAVMASCGVPGRDESFDEIYMFIERGALSEKEQQEIKAQIKAFSARTSTLYQVSGIHFIDKLPMTSVGKVKRFQLRETALAGSGGKH